ncbi:hypothetical protein PR202_ga24647 [Eleusine coracana subsp. coracana]|uniref:Uncharacterized protein n=1 Tax=Eleusine coracana subsp. coracana TaxID=191504 RepID=A0AAV5D9D1_ELECO|nr:hypothetical protein PR202_ga24647 [Eleusine coracana subsp. coracana]
MPCPNLISIAIPPLPSLPRLSLRRRHQLLLMQPLPPPPRLPTCPASASSTASPTSVPHLLCLVDASLPMRLTAASASLSTRADTPPLAPCRCARCPTSVSLPTRPKRPLRLPDNTARCLPADAPRRHLPDRRLLRLLADAPPPPPP